MVKLDWDSIDAMVHEGKTGKMVKVGATSRTAISIEEALARLFT